MAVLLIGSPYGFNMDGRHASRHTRPVTFILQDCTPFQRGRRQFRKNLMALLPRDWTREIDLNFHPAPDNPKSQRIPA
jgi:hypothetical protein